MSNQAITWALAQKIRPSSVKFTLVALANYADEEALCYPSQRRIAEDTCQSDRSVRSALAVLEERGYIVRTKRRRKDGSFTADSFTLCLNRPETQPAEKSAAGKSRQRQETAQPAENFASLIEEPSLRTPRKNKPRKPGKRDYTPDFEAFWAKYPRVKNGSKPDAFTAWRKAIEIAPPDDIIRAVDGYLAHLAANQPWLHPAHASTWLNGERWEGFLEEPEPPPKPLSEDEKRAMRLAAGLEDAAA